MQHDPTAEILRQPMTHHQLPGTQTQWSAPRLNLFGISASLSLVTMAVRLIHLIIFLQTLGPQSQSGRIARRRSLFASSILLGTGPLPVVMTPLLAAPRRLAWASGRRLVPTAPIVRDTHRATSLALIQHHNEGTITMEVVTHKLGAIAHQHQLNAPAHPVAPFHHLLVLALHCTTTAPVHQFHPRSRLPKPLQVTRLLPAMPAAGILVWMP